MLYTIILRPGFGHILHFNAKSDFTKQLQFDCFKKANLHCVGVYSWYCPQQGKGGVDGRKMEFRTISKIFQLGGGKKFEIFGILLSMSDGRKIAKFQEYTLMLHC